ncbi:MAG: hypothetical protein ABFC96_10495 [Thermoguttaceae bacterium]
MRNATYSPQPPEVQPGPFVWRGLWLAVVVAPAVGLIWARVGQVVQPHFAPLILFPILLGVLTGVTLIGVVRLTRMGHRPTILVSAVLAAAVAAAGQHYCGYVSRYYWQAPPVIASGTGDDLKALSQQLLRQTAPSFGQYLRAQADKGGRPLPWGYVAKGWIVWLSWAVDALLLVAGAVAVTVPAACVPYCSRCRSWYRAVRNGKIDLATADRLANLIDAEPPAHPRSARYRLSACQGGCGPTRCELSWEHADGVDLARTWLDAQKRNEVAAVLDGLSGEDQGEIDE